MFILNNFILSLELDFFLKETWLKDKEQSQNWEMCPPHYNNFSKPNLSGRGEGTAVVFKDSFICSEQSVAIFLLFI